MSRVVVGCGQGPNGAEDGSVRAADGAWDLFGKDSVAFAEEFGGVGRKCMAEGVSGGCDGRKCSGVESEVIVGRMVAKLEVAEVAACLTGSCGVC